MCPTQGSPMGIELVALPFFSFGTNLARVQISCDERGQLLVWDFVLYRAPSAEKARPGSYKMKKGRIIFSNLTHLFLERKM